MTGTDYRREFTDHFHVAAGIPKALDSLHYQESARQFRGRWNRWLPSNRESSILDVGCGCGEFLYFLRSLGYKNAFGIDLCEGELQHARNMGLANSLHINALDYLADKKESFDLVTAFNFLEHLHKNEILQILNSIFRALKPGGRLLAVTPNGLSPFSGSTRYWDFSHETSFTPTSWRQLARLVGFGEAHFEEYGPIPHSVPGIARVVLWGIVRLGLQAVSYIEVGTPRDVCRVYTSDMKIILTKNQSGASSPPTY